MRTAAAFALFFIGEGSRSSLRAPVRHSLEGIGEQEMSAFLQASAHQDQDLGAFMQTSARMNASRSVAYLKANLGKDGYGTYQSRIQSCKDCVTYFPTIKMGGSPDDQYRKWPNTCYVGRCNFDVPWTGGPEDENCKDPIWKCWYWGLQDMCKHDVFGLSMRQICKATCETCKGIKTKYCFSEDPISTFDDCQGLLLQAADNVMDQSRYCEYHYQIQAMSNPQIWLDKIKPFTMYSEMGTKETDCASVIQDGNLLYDDSSWVDTQLPPTELGACCQRVHEYFTCVGDNDKEKILAKDLDGLKFLDTISFGVYGAFTSYCVPLFQYPSKAEFCGQFPTSDPCVRYTECEPCTEHKGVWCPEKKTCMLKKESPTRCTNRVKPTQCLSYRKRMASKTSTTTTTPGGPTGPATPPPVPTYPWWWQLMHQGNYFSANYIPSPHVSVKQGSPGQYLPYAK